MSLETIPESGLVTLEHLHTYRFLTVPQLVRLGVAQHKQSVYRVMQTLTGSRRKYADSIDFGFVPGVGKVPRLYYLTSRGARVLAELWRTDIRDINYPKGSRLFRRDYFHRVATIDVNMAVRSWAERCGGTVEFVDTYFDKLGSNRTAGPGGKLRAKTRAEVFGKAFVPDMIYLVTLAGGSQDLSTVEIHNGRDSGRFMGQMEQHKDALRRGTLSHKYDLKLPCRVRWVFEFEATMKAAIRRMKAREDMQAYQRLVSFNTLENILVAITPRAGNHFDGFTRGAFCGIMALHDAGSLGT